MSVQASLSVVKGLANLPMTSAFLYGYDAMRRVWQSIKVVEIVKDTNNAGYLAVGGALWMALPFASEFVRGKAIVACRLLLISGRFNKMIEKTDDVCDIWKDLKPTSLYREIKYSFTASKTSSKVQKDNSWLLFKTPQKICSLVIDFGCALFNLFNCFVDVLEAARFDDHRLDDEAVLLAFKNFADVTEERKVQRLLELLDEHQATVSNLLEVVGIEKHQYSALRSGLESVASKVNNINQDAVNFGKSMIQEIDKFGKTIFSQ